jgi:hypothetical protein
MSSFASGARGFPSAGFGGYRGRPTTAESISPRAAAILAAKRHQQKVEQRDAGEVQRGGRRSSLTSAETNFLRGVEMAQQKARLQSGVEA